jgi:transposase
MYRLYRYARTQECLEKYRQIYQDRVQKWDTVKKEGGSNKLAQQFSGISRSTYYAHKKRLKDLERGIVPPSKKPKAVNKPKWGESEKQLVLQIRRTNPTYGKDKIAAILKRDHGTQISASTVDRILTH